MTKIKKIVAREVLDSRGTPTVEVDVYAGKFMGREMVPSGASTGEHEALELRDGGKRYLGKGVKQAVANVNTKIANKLIGLDCTNQKFIDQTMIDLDGTKNKSNLGANSILGVSLAVARCGALNSNAPFYEYLGSLIKNKKFEIPTPFMNVINGGEHADNKLSFQEFMIVPHAHSFKESLRIGSEVYHTLKEVIHKNLGPFNTNIGDEGGYTPNINKAEEALNLITEAVNRLGYQKEVKIAIDAAASYFYKDNQYCTEQKCFLSESELTQHYLDLIKDYPIVSIEDPFHEEAFEAFARLKKDCGDKIRIVGDDLTVTNVDRIKKAIKYNSCNTLLLKVNQIGTLTEACQAAKLVLKNGWNVMVSHRSGETEDHFIADFAVGLGTGAIKSGAPARGERTSKYNQLIRKEEQLGICYPVGVFSKDIYQMKGTID